MIGIRYLLVFCFLTAETLLLPRDTDASASWQAPFDTTTVEAKSVGSALSLSAALRLAGANNPTLKSLGFERRVAEAHLKQAGLWSNPEFELEVEEVGWDAPGLQESGITMSIAQEFELFGQRGARKQLAHAEIDATESQTGVLEFDLYLEVKRRFYTLAHAQQRIYLSQTSVKLADDIVQSINLRIGKGAALRSELLLAELEQQRTQLMLEQAQQEMTVAKAALVALWGGQPDGITVTAEAEPNFTILMHEVALQENRIDSTRIVLPLHRQSAIVRAEQSLAAAEARPNITLRGGYSRQEATNSNSFLFGVSLPLPLFNRNQGTRDGLNAQLRSLDQQINRERLEAAAAIEGHAIELRWLIHAHETLDSLLLPMAEEAYAPLQRAYEAGRLPYTQLLEVERSLNELRFEHEDMLLAIQEQIIAIESITGVVMRSDKEE